MVFLEVKKKRGDNKNSPLFVWKNLCDLPKLGGKTSKKRHGETPKNERIRPVRKGPVLKGKACLPTIVFEGLCM